MKPTWMQSLKVWWSYTWRYTLLSLAAMIVIFIPFGAIAGALGYFSMGPELKFTVTLALMSALFTAAVLYAIVIINAYVWNNMAQIRYKDFKLNLMMDDQAKEKLGRWDALCILWSVSWRAMVLGLVMVVVVAAAGMLLAPLGLFMQAMGAEFLVVMMMPIGFVLYLGLILIMYVGPYHWMLSKKRTGRYILLGKKE